MIVLPVREYKCPHCFEVFLRPAGILAYLPFLPQLFEQKSSTRSRRSSRSSKSRSGEKVYRVVKSLSRIGAFVSNLEGKIGTGLLAIFRVLNPTRWFSKRTPGRLDKTPQGAEQRQADRRRSDRRKKDR